MESERAESTDQAAPLYFWLGRIAAEDAEQERFDAAFADWAYHLDGSGAEKKFRYAFPGLF